MIYSGRTTALGHKFKDWEEKGKGIGKDCIQEVTLFDVQWSNCPVEVLEEVQKLWCNMGFGNDFYYFSWDSEECSEDYPIIHEYLQSRNVTKCLIHWWW